MKNKKDLTKLAFTALILAAAAAPVAGQADQSQDTYLAALGCGAHGCNKVVADNANPNVDPYNTRSNTYQTSKPYGSQSTSSGYRTNGSTGTYGSDTTGSYSSRPGASGSYGSDTTGSYTSSYSSRPGTSNPYGSDTSSIPDYYGNDRAGTYDASTGTYKAVPNSTGSYSSTRTSNDPRMNRGYDTTSGYTGTSGTSSMPSDSYPAGAPRGSYNPSNPGSPSSSNTWNR